MAGDDEPPVRKSDYHAARIGAAAGLLLTLIAILLIDALDPNYDASPLIVYGLLGTIGALVGVEILDLPDIRR